MSLSQESIIAIVGVLVALMPFLCLLVTKWSGIRQAMSGPTLAALAITHPIPPPHQSIHDIEAQHVGNPPIPAFLTAPPQAHTRVVTNEQLIASNSNARPHQSPTSREKTDSSRSPAMQQVGPAQFHPARSFSFPCTSHKNSKHK
ncbi:hypothetical protein PMZ80_010050 [Knufia obscura]|uniref:Uncharacterized protein n=1 Tax=Knufia obscura TaxID=1635080 RepID=A0ABR0RBB3_9EURO|nr:hypothetical protein PMZ80_010050 [Knufia obscura]